MGAKRYAAAQKLLEAAGFKEKQMAEWNLTPQEENRLESVARDEALLSQEAHSYLPTTPDEAARFNPHEWVLEAMRRAYSMGRTAGRVAAKREIRDALGIPM